MADTTDPRDIQLMKLRRALAQAHATVGDLLLRLADQRDLNDTLSTLLAKVALSDGARQLHIDGPHALPPFHVATEHQCGQGAGGAHPATDCRDYVYYHQGPPGDCQDCLQRLAAQRDRAQPDPKLRTLPGRPHGLNKEDLN